MQFGALPGAGLIRCVVIAGASTTIGCGNSGSANPPDPLVEAGVGGSTTTTGGQSGTGASSGSGGLGTGGSHRSSGGSDTGTGGAGAGNGGDGSVPSALLNHAIASTAFGTCALDAGGAILCWGCARLSTTGWIVPDGAFVALYGSIDAICAVREDGTYTCFPQPVGTPPDLSYARKIKVRSLALDRGVICGVDDQGKTFCAPAQPEYELPPPSGEQFTEVSAGRVFACGIRQDRSLLCWGSSGLPDDCSYSPIAGQLDAPTGSFRSVVSAPLSSCAIRDDGTLACWGAGEAADDPNALWCAERYNFGQSAPPPGKFRMVAAGDNHACGIREDGTIACWGAGLVDRGCQVTNTGYDCGQSLPPPGVFEQVSVGVRHSCAMRADRTVACWGWDGVGDERTTPPPVFQ
jgi:hypothetical protein